MSITTPEREEEQTIVPAIDPFQDIPTLPEEPEIPEEVVLLRRARDYIAQPRKWTRGNEYRHGATCAMGAIIHSYDPTFYTKVRYTYRRSTIRRNPVVNAAFKALAKEIQPRKSCLAIDSIITAYNDESPSKKRVLDKFDKAIKTLLNKS